MAGLPRTVYLMQQELRQPDGRQSYQWVTKSPKSLAAHYVKQAVTWGKRGRTPFLLF
jgi:hypothetical protein